MTCIENDKNCLYASTSSTPTRDNNFFKSTILTISKNLNDNSHSSNLMESFVIRFLYTDFFLILFLFGFFGNLLNLLVLLSKKMRNRTNVLFAAMAFADLGFLLLSLIPCVYMKWYIYLPGWFKAFYIKNNILTTWLINWLSAFSIWVMLAVTVERLAVVRKPFGQYRPINFIFGTKILLILFLSLLITLHKYLSIKTESDNSGKYVHTKITNNPIFTIWGWLHALSVVVIPNIVLLTCNVMLITNLRKQSFPIELAQENNQPLIISRTKIEKKITCLIVIILTTFLACNMPGAIIFLLRTLNISFKDRYYNQLLQVISNTLTTIGKVLNFGLFCLSSKHFRKSLIEQLKVCCYYIRHFPHSCGKTKSTYLQDAKYINKLSYCQTESIRLSTRERLMTITTPTSSFENHRNSKFSKPYHHSFHFPVKVNKTSGEGDKMSIKYSINNNFNPRMQSKMVDTRIVAKRAASTAL
uniref:G_PROTEIN_RECEP_F1_2 domain-containing protein n=2 Tax=Strongyloides stercoralis TaxID=6248 RepID=A0AAF5D7H4_STRER